MYIRKLTLEGFRTHAHTELDLSSGINCFIGTNDAGKSNIIRALEWLFYNTPATASVIQKGKAFARVTAEMSDGVRVIRVRGKVERVSFNRYTIEDGGEPRHFDAVGRDVPVEVREILGVSYFVEPGETTPCGLNLSRQGEASFLVQETPAKKAAVLNVFTGASRLDTAAKILRKDKRTQEQTLGFIEESLSDLNRQLDAYAYMDEAVKLFEGLTETFAMLEIEQTRIETWQEFFEDIRVFHKDLQDAKKRHASLKDYQGIEDTRSGLDAAFTHACYLRDFQRDIKSLLANIHTFEDSLTTLRGTLDLEDIRQQILTSLTEYQRLAELRESIEKTQNTLHDTVESLFSTRKLQQDTMRAYTSLLVGWNHCPTCFTSLGSEDATRIQEGLIITS